MWEIECAGCPNTQSQYYAATSRSHMTHLSQHLDIGVFFLEDPGEFCQQTQVFLSVMFLNVALHIEEFLRTEGNGCLFQEW